MLRKFLLMLFILFLLSGCMNAKKRILDDIQLATAVGYEIIDDDKVEVTAVFPSYQPDKSVINKSLTASSSLSKETRSKINLKSDKPFVSGKIEVALYEKETSEKGIKDLIDSLRRDPSIGTNIYLGVIDGSPKKLLTTKYGNLDNGIYLSNLIEQNIESGLLPKTNMHIFLYKYYSEGADPWLPIFEHQEKDVNIKAIGLFKKDKLVDQIDQEDFYIFQLLIVPKSQQISYELKLDGGEKVSIFNIGSKRKFEVPKPMENEEIKIDLKVKTSIREYRDGELTKKKIKEIEKELKKEIKTKSEKMIKRFQEKGIDPLGIGEQVRTRTRSWDKEKWKDLYPNINISVNVKVKIAETGIIE